jgi:16S rRNA processing protein RimM
MENLATGVIRTSHGIKGYVKVHMFSEEISHISIGQEILLKKGALEKTAVIEDISQSGGEPLIKFDFIRNPEDGRQYSGWEIWIPRTLCSPLQEGEYYQADIIGCDVFSEGNLVGSVVSVIDGAQAPLIEISTPDGVRLVPFMSQYVAEVNIEARKLTLAVSWILE